MHCACAVLFLKLRPKTMRKNVQLLSLRKILVKTAKRNSVEFTLVTDGMILHKKLSTSSEQVIRKK